MKSCRGIESKKVRKGVPSQAVGRQEVALEQQGEGEGEKSL